MLEVKNLCVSVDGNEILKGINLTVNAGEIHAIMGPNGSGKSTLSKVIAGHPSYEVTSGEINFDINRQKTNLLELEPDIRAKEGVFLAFQYPINVPGITNYDFLKTSFNSVCEYQGAPKLEDSDFRNFLNEKMKYVEMNPQFLSRPVNEGFSGGEKKRNEILQMAVLNPRLALLDETDSGLDIDALKIVSGGINKIHNKNNAVILVTHYQRLLDYIVPDYVHILSEGKIVKTGDKNLALELEKGGYEGVLN